MNRIFTTLIAIGLFAVAAFAQPAAQATSNGSKAYDDMLAKVKGGDTSVDFRAFRFAYVPAAPMDPKVYAAMVKAVNDKNFKEAVKLVEAVQKARFVDMNSHVMASMAYQGLGDEKKAKFHEAIYIGLVNSILKDCDGNSAKTAYIVSSLNEIPVVLNALDLKRSGQELVTEGGHKYAVVTVADKNTNEVSKVYFNVDAAEKELEKMVKKP